MPNITRTKIELSEEQIYDLRKTVSYDIRELTIEIISKKYEESVNYDESLEKQDIDVYNIIYVPEYQRDFTWDNKRQSKFIESVILGLPIPLVFVAENKDGAWEIVDGSQRIRTLNAFITNKLVLTKLEKLDRLNNFCFSDLEKSRQRKFASIPMRMIVLSESATDEVKKDMFERINRGNDLLKPMEKRKGIYIGLFRDLIYDICSKNDMLADLAPIDKWLINRQEREELVLRYFALSENNNYAHFPAKTDISQFLDEYLDKKNKELSVISERDRTAHLQMYKKEFSDMLLFVKDHFPYGFRRTHNPQTKRSIFEAISVAGHVVIKKRLCKPNDVNKKCILQKLNSSKFKQLTSGNTQIHNPNKVKDRIQYVIDILSGNLK